VSELIRPGEGNPNPGSPPEALRDVDLDAFAIRCVADAASELRKKARTRERWADGQRDSRAADMAYDTVKSMYAAADAIQRLAEFALASKNAEATR